MIEVRGIITKEDIEKLNNDYISQQIKIDNKLSAIEKGNGFGYEDPYDCGCYFPAKLINIVNREYGIIEFVENGKKYEDSVINLFVEM